MGNKNCMRYNICLHWELVYLQALKQYCLMFPWYLNLKIIKDINLITFGQTLRWIPASYRLLLREANIVLLDLALWETTNVLAILHMKFDDCQPLMGSEHIDNNWQMPFLTWPVEDFYVQWGPSWQHLCWHHVVLQALNILIRQHLGASSNICCLPSVTITWPFFSKSHIFYICF